jgi:hypothetical protein
VPVLRVVGSPEEIAEQATTLALRPAARVLDYPLDLLAWRFKSRTLARLLLRPLDRHGRRLLRRLPAPHRREIAATARLMNDPLRVMRGNTLFDLKGLRPWRLFGCSSLAVPGERSATGGPVLGRNLDFFPLGYLHEYSLVTVYTPATGRKFVAVGFPGTVGCFSGMNDAGLAVVTHEVFGAPGRGFDPRGVPFASAVRRVLETCSTVAEAEAAFRAMPRTTAISIVLCDRETAAVLEVLPGIVDRPRPVRGASVCTNHFVAPGLALSNPPDTFGSDRRHRILCRLAESHDRLGVTDVFRALHLVNMGPMTMQSMVFEPVPLRLHLAIGEGPATLRTPTVLNLGDWF